MFEYLKEKVLSENLIRFIFFLTIVSPIVVWIFHIVRFSSVVFVFNAIKKGKQWMK